MKRIATLLLVMMLVLSGCGQKTTEGSAAEAPDATTARNWEGAVNIHLADEQVTVDGEAAGGDSASAVYIENDIVYYEEGMDFTYGEGSEADAHSAAEADSHTVVHITQPGTYAVSGKLSAGQIAVDLGEDAEEDPGAVVTLVLNGVDITCTVAPAVIFYNVYECGEKDTETASETVDTSAAGANVIIADGTVNNVNGSYVARIYKPDSVELSADGKEVLDAKKLHKYDAAFYSKMSMNVNAETSGVDSAGAGTLNIHAENEGLDSELHLTINGGNINITSGNDGINTNEDGVSVTTINGGNLTITVSGETGEGDGIDSNGWLVINGGAVVAAACDNSADSGIDSDMGIHINGGFVMASGHMLDRIEDGGQNYAVLSFAERQEGGAEYTLKAEDGHMLSSYSPANAFSILLISNDGLTAGDYTLWQGDTQLAHGGTGGMGGMMGGPGGMGGGFRPGGMQPGGARVPEEWENMDFSELPQIPAEGEERQQPANMEMPEGMTPPEGMEPPEIPAGMERPDGKGGFADMERNEDGTITMPEGTVVDPETGTITLPDGSAIRVAAIGQPGGQGVPRPGGFGGQGGQTAGEQSMIFSVTDGGTMFSGITAAD